MRYPVSVRKPFAVYPRWRRMLCHDFLGFTLSWFLFMTCTYQTNWRILLIIPSAVAWVGFYRMWDEKMTLAFRERRNRGIW